MKPLCWIVNWERIDALQQRMTNHLLNQQACLILFETHYETSHPYLYGFLGLVM